MLLFSIYCNIPGNHFVAVNCFLVYVFYRSRIWFIQYRLTLLFYSAFIVNYHNEHPCLANNHFTLTRILYLTYTIALIIKTEMEGSKWNGIKLNGTITNSNNCSTSRCKLKHSFMIEPSRSTQQYYTRFECMKSRMKLCFSALWLL